MWRTYVKHARPNRMRRYLLGSSYRIVGVSNQPFFALANCLRGKSRRTLADDPEPRHLWTGRAFLASISERARALEVAYPFRWVVDPAAR